MGHSQPKYGPPYQPPADDGDGPPDPDKGQDFSGEVPNLAVPAPWSSPGPPSFNEDPPAPPAGAGDPPKDIPDVPGFTVNLASLRGGMNTMLADAQTLVSAYEDLRLGVFGSKDTVFGQNATVTNTTSSAASVVSGGGGNPTEHVDPSPAAASAVEFAASMNPAQEKVLEFAANAIELVGQFIAGVDRAGQTYAATDRAAMFPPPPENPVAAHMDNSSQS
ncbi:hypothetical protein [Actinoallomurus acaciae]|uniref:PE family protein n=1 Tax=Actinoallomurus acaciae TaxID=502577 RepID=A0ABV5YL15_9ACTN